MISRMRSAIKNDEGFTLIELMIVVAIIGILAAVAVPNFLTYRDNSRQAAVIATGGSTRAALASYAATDDNSLYPDDEADIEKILKDNGTDITGYEVDYTAVGGGESYTMTIRRNSKCATVTPNSVVKLDPCPAE